MGKRTVDEVVKAQRAIQRQADAANARREQSRQSEAPGAMQAGQRDYPERFPPQHLVKPGAEAELDPAPRFEAPSYTGSGKLAGLASIVTGGDSGIGRAVAVLFAREGADVAICHLDESEDADRTRALVEAEGRRCVVVAGDVADPAFARDAVAEAVDAFGRLDVVVGNAAFQQHIDDIADLTDAQFDLTLKTNLYGNFYLCRAAIPHLKPGGSIILTGSVTGLQGSKSLLDYSMTKGGLHAFARSLAGQLVGRGIRVNAVAPGPVWTPLNPADQPAAAVESFGSSTPMKRAAQPEEIAPAFVYLASPVTGSYVTGEILPLIGGY